jgi:hypothetical protein
MKLDLGIPSIIHLDGNTRDPLYISIKKNLGVVFTDQIATEIVWEGEPRRFFSEINQSLITTLKGEHRVR